MLLLIIFNSRWQKTAVVNFLTFEEPFINNA